MVNLAAGRVVIAVVKDAILIAAAENPIEPGTHPPAIVPLGVHRAAVLLGAVDWMLPIKRIELARLDWELPRLPVPPAAQRPSLQPGEGGEATDIEKLGQSLLERLHRIAQHIHGKLGVGANQPLVEVVLADYLEGYGPEVWTLEYTVGQQPLRGEYWDTRILGPRYRQLWPPEKHEPRTFIEIHYPPDNTTPTLLEAFQQPDPRLQTVRNSDAETADRFLRGESQKVRLRDALPFLRATLDALTAKGQRQVIAVISQGSGFEWILQPPAETQPPAKRNEEEHGAPSLVKPPR